MKTATVGIRSVQQRKTTILMLSVSFNESTLDSPPPPLAFKTWNNEFHQSALTSTPFWTLSKRSEFLL